MSTNLDPRPSFGARMGTAFFNLFWFTLRLILILAVIAGIGAAVYYGAPYVYDNYVQPIEDNTVRLNDIQSQVDAETDQLSTHVAALQTRLTEVENRQTTNAQTIAELQGQVEALEAAVESHTKALKQLETLQASFDQLTAVAAEYEGILTGTDSTLASIQRQIVLIRASEQLARARLFLSQSNFGMAKQDVEATIQLLNGLRADIPQAQLETFNEVLHRLELAARNLPQLPVVAVDDVNIAWQLLVDNLPVKSTESDSATTDQP